MKKFEMLLSITPVVLFVFLLSFKESEDAITAITYKSKIPMMMDNQLKEYSLDSMLVCNYGSLHLYEMPYEYSYINHEDTTKSFTRRVSNFLVFDEHDATAGYLFDTLKRVKSKWINADSLLKRQDYYINSRNLYPGIQNPKGITVNHIRGATADTFYITDTAGTGRSSIMYLDYTINMPGTHFSLCPELDSIRQMKLREIRIVKTREWIRAYNTMMEEFEVGWSIHPTTLQNPAFINSLFKQFESFRKEKKPKENREG